MIALGVAMLYGDWGDYARDFRERPRRPQGSAALICNLCAATLASGAVRVSAARHQAYRCAVRSTVMVCFLTTGVLAIAGILTRTYSLRSIRAIMGEEEVVRTLRNVAIDGGPSNRHVNGAGVVQLCPMEVRASATGGVDSISISISICKVGGLGEMTSKPQDDPATAIAMTRRIFDPSPEAANILRGQRFGRR